MKKGINLLLYLRLSILIKLNRKARQFHRRDAENAEKKENIIKIIFISLVPKITIIQSISISLRLCGEISSSFF